MITREQLENALIEDDEDDSAFVFTPDEFDRYSTVIALLRERIPFERRRNIICGVAYCTIILPEVDVAIEYLMEEDIEVLKNCDVLIDEESDCLMMVI